MRIGDNSFNPYGQPPRLERAESAQRVTSDNAPQQVPVLLPGNRSEQVNPVQEGEREQLLQGYLQQQAVSKDSSAGYQQQKALEAYSQQAEQGDRVQLQEILGVDEYV